MTAAPPSPAEGPRDMSDASDAIATLERSLKFSQGMHDALSGKFAKAIIDLRDANAEARAATETRDVTLMELSEAAAEIRSLRANLEEATRRYNEVVLAGLAKDAEIGRLRDAAMPTLELLEMMYGADDELIAPLRAAICAAAACAGDVG